MKKLLALLVVTGFLVGTIGCTGGSTAPTGTTSPKPTHPGSSLPTHKATPETHKATPETHKATPDTSKAAPDTHKAAPDTSKAAPKDSSKKDSKKD